jgi:chromosome segregation ATPase
MGVTAHDDSRNAVADSRSYPAEAQTIDSKIAQTREESKNVMEDFNRKAQEMEQRMEQKITEERQAREKRERELESKNRIENRPTTEDLIQTVAQTQAEQELKKHTQKRVEVLKQKFNKICCLEDEGEEGEEGCDGLKLELASLLDKTEYIIERVDELHKRCANLEQRMYKLDVNMLVFDENMHTVHDNVLMLFKKIDHWNGVDEDAGEDSDDENEGPYIQEL